MTFTLPAYHPPNFSQPPLKESPTVVFAPVPENGTAPENYHATTIFPEYYQLTQCLLVLNRSRCTGEHT